MTNNAELYKTIIKIKGDDELAINESTISALTEINRTHSIKIIDNILEDNTTELKQIIKEDRLVRNLILNQFNSVKEQLLLNLGFFNGIYFITSLLFNEKQKRLKDTVLIRSFLNRKYTKEIFKYLFNHPSARHKELAQALSLSPSGLNGILKDLIDNQIIEKTEHSKYSYYSLSEIAYNYTKDVLFETKHRAILIYESTKDYSDKNYSIQFFDKPLINTVAEERSKS